MGSLRVFNQRVRRFVAAGALLFATLVPALVPAIVSAATVTERSIALSTSAKAASGVSYEVNFTTSQANTGAFVIDFCTSAAIGTACTPPTGLSVGTPTTTGTDTVSAVDTNTVKVVLAAAPVGAGVVVPVVLGGLTNPSDAGTIYARIVTYTDSTAADSYTSANPGTHLDDGSVALAITDNFAVSGAVLETLVFCASSATIAADCAGGAALPSPSLSLGTNGVLGDALSEGTVYSQISTNASGGAVVNLKINTTGCGGLVRQGSASNTLGCGITPVSGTAAAIASGTAKFGLKLGGIAATTGAVNAASNYNTTTYFMDYVTGDATGVTSTYGSPIYNTNGAPVNNGSANLIFGANIGATTPAGSYSATLNMIATGTF